MNAAVGGLSRALMRGVALLAPIFTLIEVNQPHLAPQSQLAIFAALTLALCFLTPEQPGAAAGAGASSARRVADLALTIGLFAVSAFIVIQTEPFFSRWWSAGRSLGDRAGAETRLDLLVGGIGLLIVLEATRRAVGLALPLLGVAFMIYAAIGPVLPRWLMSHRGYGVERIVAHSFLHGQGVYGIALSVMFSYVFLFVVFGAVLEMTGATRFLIDMSRALFRGRQGGPAKVAVLSSGLMGSLSGSAVANVVTTGTFTIPLMRSSGMPPHVAAGLEAAASSGGALVPPVMGAGAYMMLELIDPPVTYLQIVRAAIIPAVLYYFSLFLVAHFEARRLGVSAENAEPERRLQPAEGVVFFGSVAALLLFLLLGFSVFRSVSLALAATLGLALIDRHTRACLTLDRMLAAMTTATRSGAALAAAAACVGIVIGVVTLTGVGSRLPSLLLPLAESNLLLALALLMCSSIVLGMGLPSAVCYLLLATLVGPVLGKLGVVPLAAHLFIFYFGMLSMVTPPVALASFAASSIAGANFWKTSLAAFRFSLVGFTLPFLFVFHPELLMLSPDGGPADLSVIAAATIFAGLGVFPLAVALSGYLWRPLGWPARLLCATSAMLALVPSAGGAGFRIGAANVVGLALFLAVAGRELLAVQLAASRPR